MNHGIRKLKTRIGRGRSRATLASLAVAALVAVWIAGTPSQVQATPVNLVANGSFENGTYVQTGTGFETLYADQSSATAVSGWMVTSGSVDWIKTYWKAEDGTYSLDLSGKDAGTIAAATSFATTVGNWYEVDFWMSGNPDGPPAMKELQVDVTSGILLTQNFTYTVTASNSDSNMRWLLKSFNFQAQSSTSTLSFISLTSTKYGSALDNVSVQLLYEGGDPSGVPEPVTMAGLLFGIGGLTGYVRRRTKK